eukprot:COSAG04_NODE_89_length_27118_cov_11.171176_5_plen_173_part_00
MRALLPQGLHCGGFGADCRSISESAAWKSSDTLSTGKMQQEMPDLQHHLRDYHRQPAGRNHEHLADGIRPAWLCGLRHDRGACSNGLPAGVHCTQHISEQDLCCRRSTTICRQAPKVPSTRTQACGTMVRDARATFPTTRRVSSYWRNCRPLSSVSSSLQSARPRRRARKTR